MSTASNLPNLDCSQVQPVDPRKAQHNVVHERKVSEERTGNLTGKAKTSVPNKKEIYEERCIVVFLGGFSACGPAFIRGRCHQSSGGSGFLWYVVLKINRPTSPGITSSGTLSSSVAAFPSSPIQPLSSIRCVTCL